MKRFKVNVAAFESRKNMKLHELEPEEDKSGQSAEYSSAAFGDQPDLLQEEANQSREKNESTEQDIPENNESTGGEKQLSAAKPKSEKKKKKKEVSKH